MYKKQLLCLVVAAVAALNTVRAEERPYVDSLFRVISSATNARDKCSNACLAFAYLSFQYRNQALMDSAYRVLLDNQFVTENRQDSLVKISILRTMGDYQYIARHFENSIRYYRSAVAIAAELKLLNLVSDCYHSMASAYYHGAFVKSAIECLYKSLRIVEVLQDSGAISNVHFNMGIYLMYDDQPQRSIEAFMNCLRYQPNNLVAYSYLAENYMALGKPDSARDYLVMCAALASSPVIFQPPYYYRTMGAWCDQNGKPDSAFYYYHKAIAGFQKALQNHHVPQCYFHLGKLYANRGATQEAIESYEKSIATGKEYLKYKIVMKASKSLAALFEAEGRHTEALHYLKTGMLYQDSLQTNEVNDMIAVQSMQREISKREQDLETLRSAKEMEKVHLLGRQKRIAFTSLGAIALISAGCVLLWRSREAKRKANSRLNAMLEELKKMQQQLVHREKLASLGSLTAGVAHEIKNPLNFVNNFSSLCAELVEEMLNTTDEEEKRRLAVQLKSNVERICEHGMRADSIVRSMLQHSRAGTGEKRRVDINQLCEEYLHLAYQGMQTSNPGFCCNLKFSPGSNLPTVTADAQDISRVILNIVTNALDELADRKDGAVAVSTSRMGDHVYVRIKDNGRGIPGDIRERIFEPFFTTKPAGKGTGLGLSLSYDIVKAHGGTIRVDSELQAGTEFCIALPVEEVGTAA